MLLTEAPSVLINKHVQRRKMTMEMVAVLKNYLLKLLIIKRIHFIENQAETQC